MRDFIRTFKTDFIKTIVKAVKIKGYLRCKTITSQNVPSKAQIKNFFIS